MNDAVHPSYEVALDEAALDLGDDRAGLDVEHDRPGVAAGPADDDAVVRRCG